MGSKHSRPPHNASFADKTHLNASGLDTLSCTDGISAEALAEFTVKDIHCPKHTRRAQTLYAHDNDRFCKYRNYFKNHHMSLAREVGRNTSKSKGELLRWVENAVGSLDEGEKYTKDEILEIAMVSAALTEYSESTLSKMYDRGELDALPNVPLHTHNLRMPGKQQACRNSSDAANKNKLEAAHYIGLEVMLRLNERLPVEHRMGEELREILNHSSNLRLVLATSNQILHKRVDAMLINASDIPAPSKPAAINSKQPQKVSMREYDRLVQIAKRAQEDTFQDAMIAANGQYLYASLRQQFNLLDVGDRPKLWDEKKDKLQQGRHSRFRSPSPARHQLATPLSPAKKRDPEARLLNHSSLVNASLSPEPKSRNPFSRLAAKLFRSHSKRRLARSSSTTRQVPREPPRPLAPKVQVKGRKKKPLAKTKTTTSRRSGNTDKSKVNSRKKTDSRVTARKTVKQSVNDSSDESASFDNSSWEDSDYTDVGEMKKEDNRVYHVGPRGGKYYINGTGKKVYAKVA